MIEGTRVVCDGEGCGHVMTRTQTHFRQLSGGWTKARTAGGSNAVINPHYTGRVLCELCFVKTQVQGEQGALF